MIDTFANAVQGAWLIVAGLGFGLGFVVGVLHFRSLEFVVQGLVAGRLSAVALQIARLAALGLVLWLLARLGALALIAGTVGLLVAKARVVGRARIVP